MTVVSVPQREPLVLGSRLAPMGFSARGDLTYRDAWVRDIP